MCVQSFVSCTLGVKHIGYNMLAYGVATVVSTLLASHAEHRRVAREALVGVAAVLQLGLLVFLLVWIPDRNLVGVFVAVSTLSGICDGFWITQCACESVSMSLSIVNLYIIIITITQMVFMVLSSRQSHCESSPGSFDKCRLSAEVAANPQTKPTDPD